MSLRPNELQACGTRAARIRHAAHGQLCSVCDPLLERPGICPECRDPVTVLGDRYLPHDREGVAGWRCEGSGAPARPLTPIAGALRDQRLRLGLRQADVAARAQVAQPTIASLEAGVSAGRVSTLERVAEAVGCRLAVVPDDAA